ncbi:MAG: MFS transporter [Deltaproteobacteria bacterium]|nr:MFS transporter [Deltaproteobacteria bacterium]
MNPNMHPDIAKRPIFRYLILLTFAAAMAQQGWISLYTNFAVDVVHVTGQQTGVVHAMREVPGLLSVGVLLCLMVMTEHTLVALSVLTLGIGVVLTGFFPTFHGLVLTAVIMSFGFHFYESTVQSLTMQYFNTIETPPVMGKIRSATAAGSLVVGIAVFVLSSFVSLHWLFCVAGSAAVIGGVWGLLQRHDASGMPVQRRKMIFRSRYMLYYVLYFLSGARRHIFGTFSIFLLVSRFHFSVREMLLFFILNNAINWFLNPLIGKAINSFGEQKLLLLKYGVLAFIFWTYSTTDSRMIVAVLYVVEQLFTNFSMAIRTFFQKIADPKDIAPSAAVGQTINHISAVILPLAGGALWMIDYRIPFWIGIGVAVLAFFASLRINPALRRAAAA